MRKRRGMSRYKSRKLFRKTSRSHKRNYRNRVSRGGIRM